MGAGEEGIDVLVGRIAAELGASMGRAESVEAACAELAARLSPPLLPETFAQLVRLGEALRARIGPLVVPVAGVLERAAAVAPDPWPLVEPMLEARDGRVVRCGIGIARRLVVEGQPAPVERAIRRLAARQGESASPLDEPDTLSAAADLVLAAPPAAAGAAAADRPAAKDPLRALLVEDEDLATRLLAARLLDRDGAPAAAETAEAMLGAEAHAFLRPLLEFTRASHVDLVHLAPRRGAPVPAVASLKRAQELCGARLAREIVALLGWPRLCLGIEARRLVGVSVHGSIPLHVRPEEAPLLEGCDGARRVSERLLLVAHGGLPAVEAAAARPDDPVVRYRGYNLAHADALREILDVAPLTRGRLERLVSRLDRIVADHVALFSAHADECAILPAVWGELRGRIHDLLRGEAGETLLSPDLTRLVLAFEDPGALGSVRTLHGLKRHLHQMGLRLGFRLVQAGRATNRTVDVVVASPERILGHFDAIHYVDFEPAAAAAIPYPVAIVAEGYTRALLHETCAPPAARVFCYGNEVHYYLTFRNHPAFVRICFAPPLQGGMVDLEYYGVSKYELESHPGRDAEGVRRFFQRLEYDVQVDAATRIHARYDKEQARDLGDVCDRAEAMFRLAPHLMDLDWVLGDLKLRDEARGEVARAWAERFVRWGVLPIASILTRDRLGILRAIDSGPAGEREIAWSGEGPYCDRLSGGDPSAFLSDLAAAVAALGVEEAPGAAIEPGHFGQLELERAVLEPLRDAVALGALEVTGRGLRRAPAERGRREHEAQAFARMLDSNPALLVAAARVARIVQGLERSLVFRVTGAVNGHEVQRACVPLHGRTLTVCVLRCPDGIARLALYAPAVGPSRRRGATAWEPDAGDDAAALAACLRAAGYEPSGSDPPAGDARDEAAALHDLFRHPNPHAGMRARSGERTVPGVPASPGRAVGRAVMTGPGRPPEDFAGAVLVAPTLRPEDGPLLAGAAGVLSTGGGILSHAGLIATQYGKPALIVPGAWRTDAAGAGGLALRIREFREDECAVGALRVIRRREEREHEWLLREGDLLVLDADREGLQILGQAPETLALHDGMRAFGALGRRLAAAAGDAERLALRGARLRARHRIETILGRLADPTTVRHALHEILLGDDLAGAGGGAGEKAALLALLLANPLAAPIARADLVHRFGELAARGRGALDEALARIPEARTVHEILAYRLQALELRDACREAADCLARCGLPAEPPDGAATAGIERAALEALERIAVRLLDDAVESAADGAPRLRHRLRELDRLGALLDRAGGARRAPAAAAGAGAAGAHPRLEAARTCLGERDARALEALRERRILAPGEAGLEAGSLIGWKAANLAEVARLAGSEHVPRWFAVTDRAFREALAGPAPAHPSIAGLPERPPSLRAAIEAMLARDDMDARAQSAAIRALWEDAALPEALRAEFAAAFRELDPGESPALVAVRSSALIEDTELAAHAGEFDTFLFVRGETAALDHLKRAWAGLWSERALQARAAAARGEIPGGGVIVQRMVDARVSGVVQTVYAAAGDPRRIVVNAGLGLGEGVVSGAVAADLVTVAKEGDLERGPLRFHYVTADKREQIVLDRRAGSGTVRVASLHHQRLRPALEYVELLELVGVAARLEEAYGYPLDIEFAIERDRLWILQVRPVPAHAAAVRETLERRPLAAAGAPDPDRGGARPVGGPVAPVAPGSTSVGRVP